jgi:drug/metabolite transporter (DMT)-like permease
VIGSHSALRLPAAAGTLAVEVRVSPTALALIFVAAVAHATWNLYSKQASASGATVFWWLVALAATVGYLPVVLLTVAVTHPHLTAANWGFMAGTGLLQAGYFLFLQRGYQAGDLSLVYPVGRGTGALLAALAGVVLLGERPGPLALGGILAIVAGIVAISLPPRRAGAGAGAGAGPAGPRPGRAAAIGLALGTGTFIATYTLWDKYAVSTLHTPPVLQGYAAFPVMLVVFAPAVARRPDRTREVWRAFRLQVAGAAVLAPAAYMLVLAALSFSAVSAVAPAREVSVLFGVILGRRMLGEGGLPRKLAAAAAIVAGIVAVAVG